MSKRSSFSGGVLVGVILGAILGVLLAPQSGAETRRKIRDLRASKWEDGLPEIGDTDTLIERTRASIEQGFGRLSEIITQNKSKHSDLDLEERE